MLAQIPDYKLGPRAIIGISASITFGYRTVEPIAHSAPNLRQSVAGAANLHELT
jgi:hypothetical protein